MDVRPLTTRLEADPDAVRIELHGQIDRSAEAALTAAYEEATGAGLDPTAPIVLSFDDVDYINSTGIALIVRFLADARRDGRTVHGRGLSAHYREIFRITRLSDYVVLDDDDRQVISAATADGTMSTGGTAQ